MLHKGYKFTNRAIQDLTAIWNYTLGQWSEKQADLYYKQIIKRCKHLSNNPEIGRAYPDVIGLFMARKLINILYFTPFLKIMKLK